MNTKKPNQEPIDSKLKVKRVPKRGIYDQKTIYRILDESSYCHVGFIHENYPVVIPTAYGRDGNNIYIHGSTASRMMKNLSEGLDVCVTVTKVHGLVLAKSAFHHSMNYESVVIFGKAHLVADEVEKIKALKAFTDHLLPMRWEEIRLPNEKEMKGTMVLKLNLDKASAKIRNEGAKDDPIDKDLQIWTGVLPYEWKIGEPVFTENNSRLTLPDSVRNLMDSPI